MKCSGTFKSRSSLYCFLYIVRHCNLFGNPILLSTETYFCPYAKRPKEHHGIFLIRPSVRNDTFIDIFSRRKAFSFHTIYLSSPQLDLFETTIKMKFVFALLFLFALAVQNSSAFVVGGRALHLKRGPFGPLKMGAPAGSVSYTMDLYTLSVTESHILFTVGSQDSDT